jgi:lipopolysaccharide biosynthesis protein
MQTLSRKQKSLLEVVRRNDEHETSLFSALGVDGYNRFMTENSDRTIPVFVSSDHTDRATLSLLKLAPRLFGFFMSPASCNSIIGDLEERQGEILRKKGRRAATIWFWREVALSFISLALDAVRKISGLEKLMRRIGS